MKGACVPVSWNAACLGLFYSTSLQRTFPPGKTNFEMGDFLRGKIWNKKRFGEWKKKTFFKYPEKLRVRFKSRRKKNSKQNLETFSKMIESQVPAAAAVVLCLSIKVFFENVSRTRIPNFRSQYC